MFYSSTWSSLTPLSSCHPSYPNALPTRLCLGLTEFYSEFSQYSDWNYRWGFAPLSSRKKRGFAPAYRILSGGHLAKRQELLLSAEIARQCTNRGFASLPTRLCPGLTEFYSEHSPAATGIIVEASPPYPVAIRGLAPAILSFIRRTTSAATGIIIVS